MPLIDQQKALDAIEKCHKRCCRADSNGDEWIHYETTLNEIEALPPVQNEPLTDAEQRIFLAAMSREKEVCKVVDKEMSDKKASYEYSLVNICGEIKRKVKAALWMN